jgi:thioredoxin 1
MAIDSVIHTNQHSIDRVLNAGVPVVLVFWKNDAKPNPQVETLLNQMAQQYAGKLLIAKVDAQAEQPLVQRFSVQQLPAYVFVKQGKPEGTLSGNVQPNDVRAWITYLVEGGARPAVQASAPTPRDQGSGNGQPVTLTDANLQQVIGGPGPVLVDFWAPWCGPCRMVAPAVEQLAREYQGRAVVGKLNVDENPQTAERYQIMSIPALYIFKNGQVVDQIVGAQPAQVLQQRLARHVN